MDALVIGCSQNRSPVAHDYAVSEAQTLNPNYANWLVLKLWTPFGYRLSYVRTKYLRVPKRDNNFRNYPNVGSCSGGPLDFRDNFGPAPASRLGSRKSGNICQFASP